MILTDYLNKHIGTEHIYFVTQPSNTNITELTESEKNYITYCTVEVKPNKPIYIRLVFEANYHSLSSASIKYTLLKALATCIVNYTQASYWSQNGFAEILKDLESINNKLTLTFFDDLKLYLPEDAVFAVN